MDWQCTPEQSSHQTPYEDFLCSFAKRKTDASKPFFKPATKKRKLSTTDAFTKIDKALKAFVTYQQAADRDFLAAEEARERREEEREEKRRKEDQEFLLKLAQIQQHQRSSLPRRSTGERQYQGHNNSEIEIWSILDDDQTQENSYLGELEFVPLFPSVLVCFGDNRS
ncbi:hypothetical protein pdam_00022310 [Pocillopora damicornis]|uniref:Uncharacterized protein n=1 Tax=Pocillopora damicornis TaxID=46731 RepID=A0A3M6U737_POCDA|nr:hypothetical protein pdam_00022310 [Pocillopora damicornis]